MFYQNKLQYYFSLQGIYFGPKKDRTKVEPCFHGVKGFHPFELFDSVEELQGATSYCLTNHILPRHEYISLFKRKITMQLYGEYIIKSVFDDTFMREKLKQHIIETILKPTYVVRQEFCKNGTRYVIMKR